MRPLASLGKASASGGAVSFLRRTEYTASQNTLNFAASTSKDLLKARNDTKRLKASVNKEDPINIMRNIVKGFDIAYPHDAYRGEDSTTNLRGAQITDAESDAWRNPKHPSNPDLKLLDSYPVVPDLEAIPSAGFYMVMKFISNPSATTGSYDERLDTAIIKPVIDDQAEARFEDKLREWEESKSTKSAPIREYDYDYYLPDTQDVVPNLKRKLDVNDPEKDDDALYPDEGADGGPGFRYKRLRTYETYNQHGDLHNLYNDSVALALHDPEASSGAGKRLAKGAYFYPLVQRTALRPQRPIGTRQYESKELVDELHVTVADPSEEVLARQTESRTELEPAPAIVDGAA